MGECGFRSLCTIIAVTALLATYLILEGMRPAPSMTANQREYWQEAAHAEKSDRLETIKEILSEKLVRLEKYYRPADDFSSTVHISPIILIPKFRPIRDQRISLGTSLKDIPVGTPIEEIKRTSNAFGLDFSFMKAVAKIEFDFDPKQRTGSYVGLFQLSNYEFAKYGSGKHF